VPNWRREWDLHPRYSRPDSGFQVRFQLSFAIILYLLTSLTIIEPKDNLYLQALASPRCPRAFVGKMSAILHIWLRYKCRGCSVT